MLPPFDIRESSGILLLALCWLAGSVGVLLMHVSGVYGMLGQVHWFDALKVSPDNAGVQVRDIAATDGGRLTLVFNPQWQTDGQIVSDFGCVQFVVTHSPRFFWQAIYFLPYELNF